MAKYKVSKSELLEIDNILEKTRMRLIKRLVKRKGIKHISRHETLGKVTEEYGEYVKEVTRQAPVKQKDELMDIAEASLFGAISI